EVEQALAAIWTELLGLEQVSRHDHFFELGGHSLLAMRLLSRIHHALGVELPLALLFAKPVLSDLALAAINALISSGPQALPPITSVSRQAPLALSFAQQRLWFLAQLEGVSATYHIPMVLHLHGPLQIDAWRRSLDSLIARHEALRSIFVSSDGQPCVELLPPETGLPLVEHDLRGLADAPEQLEQLCAEEAHAPFDLTHGPLVRARLIHMGEQEYVFLLTQHHIVSDGWSMGIAIQELSLLYQSFLTGADNPLAPLSIQYPDYAAWQREWLSGDRLQAQADYWHRQLADAPVCLELPTDHPRPAQQSFDGAALPVHLDAELTTGLKRVSRLHGTTLFMTLLAAWAAVLKRLSGQDDLIIGTPTANRVRREIEPLIGFFVNTLALRLDLSGEPSLSDLLERARNTALAAQDHQDLPFEQVVEIVQPPRRLQHTPLFQVMFAWQNNEGGTFNLPGVSVEPFGRPIDIVKFELELELGEANDCIVGTLAYATALFDAPTIERYRGYLIAMLRAMIADPAQPIAHIPILPPQERELLLETWNRTEADYPSDLCVHQLF
ncbi:non-ribosomal peptide synthetase, partial [Agrobacterium rhizogenes]|nr:non-ribosomal peptide synthetase [Rhizobium rhizogenes]NTG58640.1 non-ribosomal peptide synthetase [Rhizobium rhizogenes]NTI07181.1 non-ribosomal peptide synthetase [Rhizobium rhizogenes]NTI13995.1 non-ribosomal peptide synthetase [Rhizobium rhizogenes]